MSWAILLCLFYLALISINVFSEDRSLWDSREYGLNPWGEFLSAKYMFLNCGESRIEIFSSKVIFFCKSSFSVRTFSIYHIKLMKLLHLICLYSESSGFQSPLSNLSYQNIMGLKVNIFELHSLFLSSELNMDSNRASHSLISCS